MKQQPVICLVSFLMLTPGLQAEMYKWTNKEGKVVYSQTPPPDDRSVITIKPPPPAATQSPAERAELKAAVTEAKKYNNDILNKELRKKNCNIARSNLKMLKVATPGAKFKTEDGRKVNYTRKELDKKRKENLALKKAWCD